MTHDGRIGQRDSRRVKLQMPARLIMPERGHDVWIADLSEGGAAIKMADPIASHSGVLVWLDYRHHVEVVWYDDARCGFRFSNPLDADCVARSVKEAKGDVPAKIKLYA